MTNKTTKQPDAAKDKLVHAESKREESAPQKPGRVAGARPIEAWAKELRVSKIDLAMARCIERWPAGRVVTKEQFESAIFAGKNVNIR